MVFFNCNACGEALKKNQVEKHTLRCRHCEVLSCVDCGKDFWGNDYQSHTKCMTEEEKYCGKGYMPKVNKGEAKQEQWIEKVQGAIEKAASNPGLKSLLIRLKDYPNIPRKQQKFQNFLKNSLRIYNESLTSQVWTTLMEHSAQNSNKDMASNTGQKQEVTEHVTKDSKHVANGCDNPTTNVSKDEVETENVEPKKNKRERKEERRNKANKKEKKDRTEDMENGNEPVKSKKRKHKDSETEEQISELTTTATNGVLEEQPPKKKKKKKHAMEDHVEENETEKIDSKASENGLHDFDEPIKKKKFNWEKTITKVLEDKGEISLKKLRKKVLNEFAALDSANYSEENLLAKFDKKLRKMPGVQVLKERAKLKGGS